MPVVEDAEDPPPPTTGRRGRLVPGLVLAALLLVVAAAGVRAVAQRLHGDPDAAGFTVADRPAVDSEVRHRQVTFQGALLGDGRRWSSASARGHVLVVNFWASWCGPCRAEQPGLTAVARAFRDRGVAFVGVNVQDNRPAARAYAEEFAIPYPSLFDPAAQTATELPAVALPTTFVLDRDGVVAYQLTGKTTVPVLTARLEALLAQGGRWRR
jgi:cytochrome c biogenesis protein CcmG/thiol:disulfide interchange protein DsbE